MLGHKLPHTQAGSLMLQKQHRGSCPSLPWSALFEGSPGPSGICPNVHGTRALYDQTLMYLLSVSTSSILVLCALGTCTQGLMTPPSLDLYTALSCLPCVFHSYASSCCQCKCHYCVPQAYLLCAESCPQPQSRS